MFRFFKTPSWLKLLYPNLIWEVKTQKKELFLTFDDGPIAEVTPFVLKTLEDFDARATFFVVGENLVRNPALSEQILKGGHTIGNHTHRHVKGWSTPNTVYLKDIEECQVMMRQMGVDQFLFRPPYGRVKRSQIAQLDDYDIIMWSHLSWDFDEGLNRKAALRALSKCEPGSIIVMHDSPKSFENVKYLLPEFLQHYSELGYKFNPL